MKTPREPRESPKRAPVINRPTQQSPLPPVARARENDERAVDAPPGVLRNTGPFRVCEDAGGAFRLRSGSLWGARPHAELPHAAAGRGHFLAAYGTRGRARQRRLRDFFEKRVSTNNLYGTV